MEMEEVVIEEEEEEEVVIGEGEEEIEEAEEAEDDRSQSGPPRVRTTTATIAWGGTLTSHYRHRHIRLGPGTGHHYFHLRVILTFTLINITRIITLLFLLHTFNIRRRHHRPLQTATLGTRPLLLLLILNIINNRTDLHRTSLPTSKRWTSPSRTSRRCPRRPDRGTLRWTMRSSC